LPPQVGCETARSLLSSASRPEPPPQPTKPPRPGVETAFPGHSAPSSARRGPFGCHTERTVRSRFTPPERGSFKPQPYRPPCNLLICRASDNRTKTGMVRLRQRKGPERDGKRPKTGFRAGTRGSDEWPESPAFCAIPVGGKRRKKNVATGQTGGGKLTGCKHSFRWASRVPGLCGSHMPLRHVGLWPLSYAQPEATAPLSRLAVRRHDPRWEPGALAAHAGICAGGGEQSPSLPRFCELNGLRNYIVESVG
jgi:hypothetical protein